MKREILFRGKRIDNGEWVYGYLISPEFAPGRKFIGHLFAEDDHDVDVVEVDPETVGQYTGRMDKKEQKLFEGDIVEGIAYSCNRRGVMVWIDEIASFGVRYWRRQDPTAFENSSILKRMTLGCKDECTAAVIGNIHDNPELLEVKEK